jgi:manganese transport protein
MAQGKKNTTYIVIHIGAHGHTGIKDFIYGETVNTVRHDLRIPLLVVHL